MAIRLKTSSNRPPTVTDPPDFEFNVNASDSIDFTPYASDPDGDTLSITLNGTLETGFSFDSPTNSLNWNGTGTPGVYTGYTITASDAELSSAPSAAFSLTVIDVTPPIGPDKFGRVAHGRIGTRDQGTTAEETQNIANAHFSVWGMQPYQAQSYIDTKEDALTAVLAINPDHVVYDYANVMERGATGWESDYLDSQDGPGFVGDWFAYTDAGVRYGSFGNSINTNLTIHVEPDGNGDRWPQYFAKRVTETYNDPHNSPGVNRANIFVDNCFPRPRSNALDYRRLGSRDNGRRDWNVPGSRGWDAASEFRNGTRAFIVQLKTETEGLLVMGNVAELSRETTIIDPNDPNYPTRAIEGYEGILNGGWVEGFTGDPVKYAFPLTGLLGDGSTNVFGSFRRGINQYLVGMRLCIAPRHVLVETYVDITTNNRNIMVGTDVTSAAMRVARFGICCAWLDDGYAEICDGQSPHNRAIVHDYYGYVNSGTTGLQKEWHGGAIDNAMSVIEEQTGQSNVWIGTDENGIHKREYEWCLNLVNSRKATSGSINIPVVQGGSLANGQLPSGDWYLVDGEQDPSVDTGQRIDTTNFPGGYNLANYDGRCLVRAGYSAKYP